MLELTEKTFDQVVEANANLVIEFSAEWCAPCKSFRQVLENVEKDYSDFLFAAVDIDKEKQLAEEFEVRSIPALMILRNRTVVSVETGIIAESVLRELLTKAQQLNLDQVS